MEKESKEESEEGPSVNYVVGSVSSSLFPKKSAPKSGSLSALFKAAPVVNTLLFVPAPKPESKSVEVKEEVAVTIDQNKQQQTKKAAKEKSSADIKLESRESALQNADEEEQVLKKPKKTKRKAVGDEMGEGGDAEEGMQKKKRTGPQMAEERIKLKRTVFVGNLPASCTKKTLQLVFKGHGAIETIRFRSVVREDPGMARKVAAIQRKVHPKKQSINAYVVFKDEEGAEKALERNGMEIEKDFHIRVDKVTKNLVHDHKRSIFIGNLPYDITELPLRQHFEQCGKVEGVRLVRDKDSGMGKGFGYILFENIDAVQLALKLDSSKVLGRSIRVKRSVKKEKDKKKLGPRGKGPKKNTNKRPRKEERVATGAEKRPTKGDFKNRQGPSGTQNKSVGKQSRMGPEKKTRKPFKRTPDRPAKSTTGPSFKGEMADPNSKKAKAKALKKKLKPRRRNQVIHI